MTQHYRNFTHLNKQQKSVLLKIKMNSIQTFLFYRLPVTLTNVSHFKMLILKFFVIFLKQKQKQNFNKTVDKYNVK